MDCEKKDNVLKPPDNVCCVVGSKVCAADILSRLGTLHVLNPSLRPAKCPDNQMILIPLVEEISDAQLASVSELMPGIAFSRVDSTLFRSKKSSRMSIPLQVRAILGQLPNPLPECLLEKLPQHWNRLGDVIVLPRLDVALLEVQLRVCKAFRKASGARVICVTEGTVTGDLRQPCVRVVDAEPLNSSPETIHRENGVSYVLDVTQVMFASGNGTERGHFRQSVSAAGQVVVDMFAGIGYFTLPLICSLNGAPKTIFALEKNPRSFELLKKGLLLAKGPSERVICELGDNRECGVAALGQADRVIMGYLPDASVFLGRALQFMRKPSGILHYHYLAKRSEVLVLGLRHVQTHLDLEGQGRIAEFESGPRIVKSYAPQLFHCVADVLILPP